MCAQAIECLKGAVQIDDGHAQAYYNLGKAYLQVGDKDLALEQHRILQGLNPVMAGQLYSLIQQ
jgi:tetratricopeptide (TPR) repeat protein